MADLGRRYGLARIGYVHGYAAGAAQFSAQHNAVSQREPYPCARRVRVSHSNAIGYTVTVGHGIACAAHSIPNSFCDHASFRYGHALGDGDAQPTHGHACVHLSLACQRYVSP